MLPVIYLFSFFLTFWFDNIDTGECIAVISWMKILQFEVQRFNCKQEVSICTLGPDFDHDGKVDVAKYMKITFGKVSPASQMISEAIVNCLIIFSPQWVPGLSAGGCRNNLNLFSTNPQVRLIHYLHKQTTTAAIKQTKKHSNQTKPPMDTNNHLLVPAHLTTWGRGAL